MMRMPDEATARVARIEAMLDEAERMLARGGATDEASYSLRETRTRYLPDTLRAYLDVPPSLRGERDATGRTPDELLVAQLDHLERATAQRLRELAARSTDAVAANGAFLAERFGAAESLPDPVPLAAGAPAPTALVRTLFEGIARDAGAQPAALVAIAADRFNAIVPQLVSVRRGMFGLGAVESFSIDVPLAEGMLRYSLAARGGGIEATATKVVRGVALRSVPLELDAWLQELYTDLGTFIERDRRTRDILTRFLEQ